MMRPDLDAAGVLAALPRRIHEPILAQAALAPALQD
jgi:hypothetical protein